MRKAVSRGAVRSVAQGWSWTYTPFTDHAGSSDFASVEKDLAKLDDLAAKIIHRIEKREQLTSRDRTRLSRFASVMWRRTPKHRAKVNRMATDLLPQVLRPLETLSNQLNDAARSEIERIRREYPINPPQFLFAQHVLRESDFEQVMYAMDWAFFEPPLGGEFLTSDDPVLFSTGSGLGNKDAVKQRLHRGYQQRPQPYA